MRDTDPPGETEYPWTHPDLHGWLIVGMNHYLHVDEVYLFVAMTSGNYCIRAEGPDDQTIWASLRKKARAIDARQLDIATNVSLRSV